MKMKKMLSAVTAAAMVGGTVPAVSGTVSAENEFNPETTMWTDNLIEEVLQEESTTKYENAAEVNPNGSNKDSSGHQSPYGNPGAELSDWAYAEYLWTHGYPVGNGRMGAMVAGGINKEVIQVNEDTIWDGSPYGDMYDEEGNRVSKLQDLSDEGTISVKNQTSGSKREAWRYYRGAKSFEEYDTPAEIGADDAVVGDESFRSSYPEFANKSISSQALNVDNSHTNEAVQGRYSMERMVEKTFLGEPTGQRAYKSFVEVYLDFGQDYSNVENYKKSLDMTTGIVTVDYSYEDAHFTRNTFASYPDQAVVTHIESDKPLNFNAELHTYHSAVEGYYTYTKVNDHDIKLTAAITDNNRDNSIGRTNVIQFEAHMLLDSDSGAEFVVSDDNKSVNVKGGKDASVYVVGASNYVDYLNLDNSKPSKDCGVYVSNIENRKYDDIKSRHIEDFSEMFNSSSLNLGNANDVDNASVPTEERVRKPVDGKSGFTLGAGSSTANANKNGVYSAYSDGDNQLAALEFNFGKYLLISGSRDGREKDGDNIAIPESQPLNLTGKWNAAMSASWNGKYTININTEMNYWPSDALGLSECERPLIDVLKELAQAGSVTADNQYAIGDSSSYQPGDAWVMHHNFDLWRGTQPIDNATAGLWPTGGAWLLDHAWQYYQYTGDKEYLAEIYPYMKGSAKFFTQFLVLDPKSGYLVTAASCSPEQGGVQPGPAMDTQIIRNLYDMVTQSANILGKTEEDKELLDKIAEQMPSSYLADEKGKLAPNTIDEKGLINEWARGDVTFDFSGSTTEGTYSVVNPFKDNAQEYINEHIASNNDGHRHCSHLWEMYPGTHVSAYSDDENEQKIYEAFCKSVTSRGTGSGQGWGVAWRISLNARAHDGNSADKMLEQLFTTRTSPDLIDQHPNFQIDGNFGATAGIIEMLLQSHDGSIEILPALPDKWSNGEFKHFKARGNVDVSVKWDNNAPTEAKLIPENSGELKLRTKYAGKAVVKTADGTEVKIKRNKDGNLITFEAEAGKEYIVTSFGESEKPYIEATWSKSVSAAENFFASQGTSKPKFTSDNTEVGYIYNLENTEVGYSIPNCDVTGMYKIGVALDKKTSNDTPHISVRLDSADGTEIAGGIITASKKAEQQFDVNLPEGITGEHDLYFVYYTDYDGAKHDKWVANAGDITGYYRYKNPNYVEPTEEPDEPTPTPSTPEPTAPATPEPTAPATPEPTDGVKYTIEKAEFNNSGKLNISYTAAADAPNGILAVVSYNESGAMISVHTYDIDGTGSIDTDAEKPQNSGSVKVFIVDSLAGLKPLGIAFTVK